MISAGISTRLVWGSVRDLDRPLRWRLDAGDRVSALKVRSAQKGRKRQHYERSCWFCRRPLSLLLNDHALRHILPNASGYARLIRQLDGTKDMDRFRPKYVTFDCHGTLINFQMAEAARDLFGRPLDGPRMDEFIKNFAAYRLDEVMQDWKPFADIVHNSLERTCRRNNVAFRAEDAQTIYNRIPTWGPHQDVPEGLAKLAKEIPLVILSNATTAQIPSNVAKLGAPFHAVYTAEQARAYKPHFKAFEYMFDMLGCGPENITHVSSSFRYDLMSAYDLGIKNKVWVNRRHEPANPYYEYTEISDVNKLPGVFGL